MCGRRVGPECGLVSTWARVVHGTIRGTFHGIPFNFPLGPLLSDMPVNQSFPTTRFFDNHLTCCGSIIAYDITVSDSQQRVQEVINVFLILLGSFRHSLRRGISGVSSSLGLLKHRSGRSGHRALIFQLRSKL